MIDVAKKATLSMLTTLILILIIGVILFIIFKRIFFG